MSLPAWRQFWAKTFPAEDEDREEASRTHPLWAHLIDVANVADLLWDAYLPGPLREAFFSSTSAEGPELRRWMSLSIGLHDTGKAIPGFQSLHGPTWAHLNDGALAVEAPEQHRVHHGHATAPALFRWIEERAPSETTAAYWKRMAAFVSYHHGRLQTFEFEGFSGPLNDWTEDPRTLGPEAWRHARRDLISNVASAWVGDEDRPGAEGRPEPEDWPKPQAVPDQWPPWLLGFAGWATLADWIGSMSAHYPKDFRADGDVEGYIGRSREGARKALEEVGIAEQAPIATTDFAEMFGFSSPRALQMITGDVEVSSSSSLTIIEAPTGEGKTEAAFRLAARQQASASRNDDTGETGSAGSKGGIYVGMPTRATSNGLFPRFEEFLRRSCAAGEAPNLVLVHGTADLHPSRQRLLGNEPGIDDVRDEAEGPTGGRLGRAEVQTRSWFLPKKRSLLASYGVGTVDQTFLGVLYSKHFFLRLLGLAGKTVIFDEVHAYDTYMGRLFKRLLGWLRALGTNVILLSATLPSSSRNQMLEAWANGSEEDSVETTLWDLQDGELTAVDKAPSPDYPALWRAGEGEVEKHVLTEASVNQGQEASLKRQAPGPSSIAEEVEAAIEPDSKGRGACVAVIVNTVTRAQKIYSELQKEEIGLPSEDVWLLHARFPQGGRSRREEAVVGRFGPERTPGKPGILVATQVAEQSLDLDFDLMMSDLAPIDLLLQRAGRLHRHQERHGGKRPGGYRSPTLRVMYPAAYDGRIPALEKHGMGFVYDSHVLYRTWDLLRRVGGWSLPEDYRPFIEEVYEEEGLPERLTDQSKEKWREARQDAESRRATESSEARARIIPSSGELRGLAETDSVSLAGDEDPDVHRDLQALTRWSEIPSADVICLHLGPDGKELYLDRDCTNRAPLGELPSPEATRQIMKQAIRLSGRELAPYLQEREDPEWEELTEETPALLNHQRVVFEDGRWEEGPEEVPDLQLDSELGVLVGPDDP